MFIPYQNMCIDESLMVFKGRLLFKQYIPSKRHRFGIRFFVMCDCKTGYVLDFIIYTGGTREIGNFDIANIGKLGSIVLTLMNEYLNKGHTVYVGNWYTRPALFSHLFANKTNACDTVKANRKGMPVMNKKLKAGEIESKASKNLLAIKWHDKRDVMLLSTMHTNEFAPSDKVNHNTGKNVFKPITILDYKENMGSIDWTDMMLSSTETVIKSIKWYKKTFSIYLTYPVLNAPILYNQLTQNKHPVREFQINLIKQLLSTYHTPPITQVNRVGVQKLSIPCYAYQLDISQHFFQQQNQNKTQQNVALYA